MVEAYGDDVGLKIVRHNDELVEELYAKDAAGSMRLIFVSPTHPAVSLDRKQDSVSALSAGGDGLFAGAPSFRFSKQDWREDADGWTVTLTAERDEGSFAKRIFVPKRGPRLEVRLDARLAEDRTRIQYLLMSYAFAPDGKKLSAGGRPDLTVCPALRPERHQVVGDHYFRAPSIIAQQGALAGTLIPDLDLLAEERAMPTIADLDAKSGVVDATLLSYGFCDHRLSGHVYYTTNPGMRRRVPSDLVLGMDILLDARAEPFAAYRPANDFLWERYGRRYYDLVKPQALPFAEYPRFCYPAAFAEKQGDNQMGWFEVEIDGRPCGGIMAGWGYQQGWASWQAWFNNLRSAWGMKYWGKRLPGAKDWAERADKMLNLALAAPMDRGACPTTYQSRQNQWKGSLITPNPDCWYDLTNMAWKGIWLLRWYTDFDDCPRKDEILRQCKEMADCMIRKQNSDGSFPTWLDKDHKPQAVLNHSASSALPAWFLVELAKVVDEEEAARLRTSAIKCADFLLAEVVDQQRYYDFETFFSCSPKPYRIHSGPELEVRRLAGLDDAIGRPERQDPAPLAPVGSARPDHEAMLDPHTLQPPQNTLCMQWTAEALRGVYKITKDEKYMSGALKALDTMITYQNVWPISFRPVAYTFGGFGVQNSDGEYHDARQAQFGATLCDFGADLGRRDLFERGVAAVRASLALVNHPLHDKNGIYPNPNYPLGLMPENCGHGGTNQQNGRTGFDWGEGSGITSMGYLLMKYGSVYVDDERGWAVGIDGVVALDAKATAVASPLNALPHPWTGPQNVEVVHSNGQKRQLLAQGPLAIRRIDLDWQDDRPRLVAIPAWMGSGREMKAEFVVSSQKPRPASRFGPPSPAAERFAAKIDPRGLAAEVPVGLLRGAWVWMEGAVGGQPIRSEPVPFWIDPIFGFTDWRMPGWTVEGDFAEVPTRSTRFNFNAGGLPFIGTCEDGMGGYNDAYMGTITSPAFFVTKDKIRLLVGGGSGKNVYVELIDADTGEQLAIERGHNREFMDERVWDVKAYRGRRLQIRAVDREQGGWGHINLGHIRCE